MSRTSVPFVNVKFSTSLENIFENNFKFLYTETGVLNGDNELRFWQRFDVSIIYTYCTLLAASKFSPLLRWRDWHYESEYKDVMKNSDV